MVDKRIIYKIISDIIVKHDKLDWGEKSSLNNKVKGKLNKFFEETRNFSKEKVSIITNDGRVIYQNMGEHNKVSCPSSEILKNISKEEVIKMGGLHTIHNHPIPVGTVHDDAKFCTCFSEGDLNFFANSLDQDHYLYKSMTCQCNNGSRMTIIRHTDDFNRETYDEIGANLRKNFAKYLKDCSDYVKEQMPSYYQEMKKQGIRFGKQLEMGKKKVQELEYEYSKKYFKEYIQEDIDDFDKLGFELNVVWMK